jgi:glycosyltransferase involved in cell wall biosynthesis
MSKSPYILFLPKWYPCRNMALNGIFIQRHAKSLSSLINVVVLYAIYDDKLKHTWYEKEEEMKDGVWTVRYYYNKNITGLGFIDKVLKFLIYFFCLLKGYRYINHEKGKPLLIHAHVLLRTGIFVYFCKLFLNINYVISEHWSGYLKECGAYAGFIRKKTTEFIVRRALRITTVSEALKNSMLSHGLKGNYSVIPNVVDTDKFLCESVRPIRKKIKVICIADLKDEVKNISAVLNSVKKISEKRNDFELILIGEGPDENKYRQFCIEHGLLDIVVFIRGYIEPALIPSALCESDFLLLYSHFETQGTVILEAMSCGKPVLAAEVGGMKELLNEERGILVKVKNDQDLYEKLNFMLDNFRKYDSVSIRRYVLDNFSDRIVGKKFYDLYTDTIGLEKK